jgi:coronin-1B/1C/6
MFVIPDEGVTTQIKDCDSEMLGHSKKVSCFKFNPTVEFTLASASTDLSLKIWDIQNQSFGFSYDNLGEQPWNIDWNWNGSRVGCATKGKKVHVMDPRDVNAAQVFDAHQSSKG